MSIWENYLQVITFSYLSSWEINFLFKRLIKQIIKILYQYLTKVVAIPDCWMLAEERQRRAKPMGCWHQWGPDNRCMSRWQLHLAIHYQWLLYTEDSYALGSCTYSRKQIYRSFQLSPAGLARTNPFFPSPPYWQGRCSILPLLGPKERSWRPLRSHSSPVCFGTALIERNVKWACYSESAWLTFSIANTTRWPRSRSVSAMPWQALTWPW